MSISLTEQQQAVVDHNTGAALVFAAAGAGKTTAMVHRIERLVRERIFEPSRILATSFGKMNERDLRTSLSPWPSCQAVQVSTLHALTFNLIRTARQRNLLRQPTRRIDISKLNHSILNFAIAESASRNAAYKREMFGMDRQDFLDYISYCKSNLAYANLRK
ncbi:MAG TPA: ATP-dependent helicase, partial [Anaerolineae bacterium]|nr:ATP-dependent helicase [Anaerolineae bacterium]